MLLVPSWLCLCPPPAASERVDHLFPVAGLARTCSTKEVLICGSGTRVVSLTLPRGRGLARKVRGIRVYKVLLGTATSLLQSFCLGHSSAPHPALSFFLSVLTGKFSARYNSCPLFPGVDRDFRLVLTRD